MKGNYTATRTKNLLKKILGENHEYEYRLSNISVNGSIRGCSGYVMDKETGAAVYLNTEPSAYRGMLYCRAYDPMTGTSGNCQHNSYDYEGLFNSVKELLNDKSRCDSELGLKGSSTYNNQSDNYQATTSGNGKVKEDDDYER